MDANFATALAKAQAGFEQIRRDRTVTVTSQRTGQKYTFAYAPFESLLRATHKALTDNGFAVTQSVIAADGVEYVETTLRHAAGEISNRTRIINSGDGPQAYGSALTYARRYGYSLLLNLCADDDDDANAAEGNSVVDNKITQAVAELRKLLTDDMPEDARQDRVYHWHLAMNADPDSYIKASGQLEAREKSALKAYVGAVREAKKAKSVGNNGRVAA